MSSARTIYELARQELQVILRTRRALIIAGLYLGLAVLGGIIYVLVVRAGEDWLYKLMSGKQQQVPSETALENMRNSAKDLYQKLALFFSGVDTIEELANSLRESVILPAFFWCSLAFLPFTILLSSFDQLSSDLSSRSICYSVLRAHRAEILLGKAAAHTVLFIVLSAVASAILVAVASALLDTVTFGATALGLLRIWLLLLPFGLCYLAISAFCSAANTQPVPALVSAVGIIIALRIIGWLRYIPDTSEWAWLQGARWLSPATYQEGMWRVGFVDPALSAMAYLGFAVVFFGIGIAILMGRDL